MREYCRFIITCNSEIEYSIEGDYMECFNYRLAKQSESIAKVPKKISNYSMLHKMIICYSVYCLARTISAIDCIKNKFNYN